MEKQIERAIEFLTKHGFKAVYAADEDEARRVILARIPKDAKV